MLTHEQMTRLRLTFHAHWRRPAPVAQPWKRATCVDGPLAGLCRRVTPEQHQDKRATWAWSIPLGSTVITARYEQSGKPGLWKFAGYSRPGGKNRGPWVG